MNWLKSEVLLIESWSPYFSGEFSQTVHVMTGPDDCNMQCENVKWNINWACGPYTYRKSYVYGLDGIKFNARADP